MKIKILTLFLLLCFHVLSQIPKSKHSQICRIKIDSLENLLMDENTKQKKVQDSLTKVISNLERDNEDNSKNTINSDKYNTDYVLINNFKWAATNFGGTTSFNSPDKNADQWLEDNGFYRCDNQKEWSIKIKEDQPSYFLLEEPLFCVGYFFNLPALKKLEKNPPKGWRIANHLDFKNLYDYSKDLNIKSITPFQLLVSNYTRSEDKAKSKLNWTSQTIYNIYNLSLFPVSYFNGYESMIEYNNHLIIYSHFNEGTNKIYCSNLSPKDKSMPVEIKFGEDGFDYGFLVRLINK